MAHTLALPLGILASRTALAFAFAPEPAAPDFGTRGGGMLAMRPSAFCAASEDIQALEQDMPWQQKRYGELKRLIQGVSDKVLIQQLKDLEADHVLARTDYKEVPPRVDYALTPLGRSLADAIVPLCTWGTEHMAELASIFAKRDTLP